MGYSRINIYAICGGSHKGVVMADLEGMFNRVWCCQNFEPDDEENVETEEAKADETAEETSE